MFQSYINFISNCCESKYESCKSLKSQVIKHQSAEHLDMPTDAILQPTNQNQSVNDPPTNQIKLLPTNLSFLNTNIYVFIIEIG